MDPLAFCRQVMAEYEEQWTEAHGHQERHPLRAKKHALQEAMDLVQNGEDLDRIIQQGCTGDDPMLFLLCEDLRPRWEKTRGKR